MHVSTHLLLDMSQIPENILVLIEKYQAGTASSIEKKQLNDWYYSFNDQEVDLILSETDSELALEERIRERILETIRKNKGQKEVKALQNRWLMPAIAASFILLFSVGILWKFGTFSTSPSIVSSKIVTHKKVQDIAPGGNKAILTLMDGSSLILDSTANGTISHQGSVSIQKLENGQLAYNLNENGLKESGLYNTISTPRGGQYHITLSDGSKIWLNAASSIRFPVAFTGKTRKVEITGEAYFEVAKNKEMPFHVIVGSSEIEVLGTHFNINSYNDESAIKTTLLEGSVKVSNNLEGTKSTSVYLVPGQQAGISKDGKISVSNNADFEETLAWKNGRFHFKSADLNSILRQISRWYNVDIEYNGKVDLHFSGQLTRNENVSKVLEKLELTGEVNFKIDGNKIIVSR
jgi:hypothetical protein